jgi:amino acid transporter
MENQITDTTQKPTRNIFLRIIFGFLWFVLIYFVTSALVGGVVGAIAGAGAGDPQAGVSANLQAGANAGRQATLNFMNKYGLIVILCQIILFAVLCFFGLLPGVGKYKKSKQT